MTFDTVIAEFRKKFDQINDGYIIPMEFTYNKRGEVNEQWHLCDIEDFLRSSLTTAYAEGEAKGRREERERIRFDLATMVFDASLLPVSESWHDAIMDFRRKQLEHIDALTERKEENDSI